MSSITSFFSENSHIIMLYTVMILVTLLIRLLPYVVFAKRKTPEYIIYLGKVLPYAIIGMLVVYCLKDVQFTGTTHGIPEAISLAVVTVIHIWKKNMILSMIVGTALYMLLVQLVFI